MTLIVDRVDSAGIGRSHSANDTFTPRMPRTLLNRSRNSRETITGGDLVVRLSHTYQKDITPSGSNVYSFWQCACACAPSQTPGSRHAQKTVSGCKWVLHIILCSLLFFVGHVFFWKHCRTTAVTMPRGRRASEGIGSRNSVNQPDGDRSPQGRLIRSYEDEER